MYEEKSVMAGLKLIQKIDEDKFVWNAKYARRLILNSTWIGYAWIEEFPGPSTLAPYKDFPFNYVKVLGRSWALGPDTSLGSYRKVSGEFASVCMRSCEH